VTLKGRNSTGSYAFIILFLTLIYLLSLLNILFNDVFKYPFWLLVIVLNCYLYCVFAFRRGSILLGCLTLTLYLLLSVHGLQRGNFESYLYFDIIIFSFFSFLFFFNRRHAYRAFLEKIPKIVCIWLFFGLIVSWFLFIESDLRPATLDDRFSVHESIKEFGGPYKVIEPLSPALFIVPFYYSVRSRWRYLIILSLLTIFIFSIFTATRGTFIVSLLPMLYLLFGKIRRGDWSILEAFRYLVLAFIVIVCLSQFFSFESVLGSFEVLGERFFNSEDFSSGRKDERRLFLASLNESEWIIGRGMGGAQQSWIWKHLKNGLNMVHYGHLLLLLKGGLILLISVYSLVAYCVVRGFSKKKMLLPFVYMIVVFFLYDQFHTQWQRVFSVVFLWLACSGIIFSRVALDEGKRGD
jgi:hypothetical protein